MQLADLRREDSNKKEIGALLGGMNSRAREVSKKQQKIIQEYENYKSGQREIGE